MEKHKRSIPVDFSKMSVRNLFVCLEILEDLVKEAEKTQTGCISGDTKSITVPLKCLAKVFGIKYSTSIELSKISQVLTEAREELAALSGFEKLFFSRLDNGVAANSKRKLKVVENVSEGGWAIP
jgi:hypothetical protein